MSPAITSFQSRFLVCQYGLSITEGICLIMDTLAHNCIVSLPEADLIGCCIGVWILLPDKLHPRNSDMYSSCARVWVQLQHNSFAVFQWQV